MPTESGPEPAVELHRHRRTAESFGLDPERYDRARPPYPDALVHQIVADRAAPRILDVGCGTGILARQLQSAGATVLGVEPDARMADYARGRGLTVDGATFEAWEPAGRRFEVVTAGQSWHWVDPAAGAERAAQVLVPGGWWWAAAHVLVPPPALATATAIAVRSVAADSPFAWIPPPDWSPEVAVTGYQDGLARAGAAFVGTGRFGPVQQWRFDWERHYTGEQWLQLTQTTGMLTGLSAEQREPVLAALATAAAELDGGFTMRSATVAVSVQRTG